MFSIAKAVVIVSIDKDATNIATFSGLFLTVLGSSIFFSNFDMLLSISFGISQFSSFAICFILLSKLSIARFPPLIVLLA